MGYIVASAIATKVSILAIASASDEELASAFFDDPIPLHRYAEPELVRRGRLGKATAFMGR